MVKTKANAFIQVIFSLKKTIDPIIGINIEYESILYEIPKSHKL